MISASKSARKSLTQARLKELLHYDPEAGVFIRKTSGTGYVAGMRSGSLKKHGYRTMDVDGGRYYEHRLAFLYMTGQMPVERVDHIDGDRSNNSFSNLRPANALQNVWNRRINKTNKVGLKGVVIHINPQRRKRFGARIRLNGKATHLGWFDTPEEAHAIYATAARRFFGEFARTE